MLRPYEPLLMTLLRFADALTGALLFLGLNSYFQMNLPHNREAALVILLLAPMIFHELGIYRSWRFSSLQQEISQIISGCLLLYTVLFIISYFLKISEDFSRVVTIHWMFWWPILLSFERVSIRMLLRTYRQKGHNVRLSVIAGARTIGTQLAQVIKQNPWSGAQLVGFFDDTEIGDIEGIPVLGKLAELSEYVKTHHVDIVYLALPVKECDTINFLLKELRDSTISVFFIPDILLLDLVLGGSLIYFENFPVIALRDTPFLGVNSFIKRLEDIVLSLCILLLTSPFFLVIAIIIKCTSKGPSIFKQHRYGLHGEHFVIYKFRTMTVCEDGYHFKQATKNDVRITPFGAFLRSTSLDELPQFLNVLQGRMSIVGPRPHPIAMNEEFRKLVAGYMLRHKVKPGITGLAQINGFRGETDTLEKMENRIKYDLEYLRQWSLLLDLKIIVQTVISGAWRNNAV